MNPISSENRALARKIIQTVSGHMREHGSGDQLSDIQTCIASALTVLAYYAHMKHNMHPEQRGPFWADFEPSYNAAYAKLKSAFRKTVKPALKLVR